MPNDRLEFLGAYVNKSVKARLRREAERAEVSLSTLVDRILADHFKVRIVSRTSKPGSGRTKAQRAVLTPEFLVSLYASLLTPSDLSAKGVSRAALKGRSFPYTQRSKLKLKQLAKDLEFKGRIVV